MRTCYPKRREERHSHLPNSDGLVGCFVLRSRVLVGPGDHHISRRLRWADGRSNPRSHVSRISRSRSSHQIRPSSRSNQRRWGFLAFDSLKLRLKLISLSVVRQDISSGEESASVALYPFDRKLYGYGGNNNSFVKILMQRLVLIVSLFGPRLCQYSWIELCLHWLLLLSQSLLFLSLERFLRISFLIYFLFYLYNFIIFFLSLNVSADNATGCLHSVRAQGWSHNGSFSSCSSRSLLPHCLSYQ